MAAAPAARGGSIPYANARGFGLRMPGKPVALADITNTGKPNHPGSIHTVADALKENAELRNVLAERTKAIEASKIEMQKIRLALHAVQQKNLQLVQANSQMLAEMNQGKDRLKVLQHELACTTAVLKVKDYKLEKKNKAARQPQKKAKLLVTKAMPSRSTQAEAHRKATSAIVHHLVDIQSAVPSYTSCQERLHDETTKRQKSESCEIPKDTNTMQHSCKPNVQSSGSSHGDDLRRTLQRSARLNPGSCEVTELSCETLHEDVIVPLAPPSSSVPKQQETYAGNDMAKSLINELPCEEVAHKLEAPELKKKKRSTHEHKEVYLEEAIEEASSRFAGVEMNEIDDEATRTDPKHLAVTESSHPFNIEHPEPSQYRGNRRKSTRANKRKLESYEGRMISNIEEGINTKCHSNSSMPLNHAEKRKLPRRKSSRLDPGSCEVTNDTFKIVQEDIVAPSSINVLIEQTKNDMQNGCTPSTKPSEEHATGRSSVGRPSRRAAEKIVSYKEIHVNAKMRRP
ncbi:hypothetical protein GUJ93_ZPchr0002g23322 [Zizania palustris]|uniref:Shugoshin C-terminal domain-containing protein n=1 Tax=Zizania palustris TaxID=103762 RepID=A0A8J5S8G0_ZIZPA|nr:hypothetical protein GUJ93_ZPchr0002g23322 [Zizania palustris]